MKAIFKAQLGLDSPVVVVGEYEFDPEEWEDTIEDYGSAEDWRQNAGSDWAYEAVHSDCLNYWCDLEDD